MSLEDAVAMRSMGDDMTDENRPGTAALCYSAADTIDRLETELSDACARIAELEAGTESEFQRRVNALGCNLLEDIPQKLARLAELESRNAAEKAKLALVCGWLDLPHDSSGQDLVDAIDALKSRNAAEKAALVEEVFRWLYQKRHKSAAFDLRANFTPTPGAKAKEAEKAALDALVRLAPELHYALDSVQQYERRARGQDGSHARTSRELSALLALLTPAPDAKAKESYMPWENAGGPNECAHGYPEEIPCPDCQESPFGMRLQFRKPEAKDGWLQRGLASAEAHAARNPDHRELLPGDPGFIPEAKEATEGARCDGSGLIEAPDDHCALDRCPGCAACRKAGTP